MVTPSPAKLPSDLRRDAQRYADLLLALKEAIKEIRTSELENPGNVDEILKRMLRHLAGAVNAEKAFVAVPHSKDNNKLGWLEILTDYPTGSLHCNRMEWTPYIDQLVKDGKALVINSSLEISGGLPEVTDLLGADSVILVRLQTSEMTRIIGVCDRVNLKEDPFLAPDRTALESIVELIAFGAMASEQKARQSNLDLLVTIQSIAYAYTWHDGLEALAKGMVENLKVTFCHFATYAEERGTLRIQAAYPIRRSEILEWNPGVGIELNLKRLPAMKAIIDLPGPRLFQRGEKFEGQDIVLLVQKNVGLERELHSVLVIPLREDVEEGGKAKEHGVCILGEMHSREGQLDEQKQKKAVAFASQALVLINRLHLQEQADEHARREELLRRAGEEISSLTASDYPILTRRIAKHACELLGADCAVVYPYHDVLKTFDVHNIGSCDLLIKKRFKAKKRNDPSGIFETVIDNNPYLVVDDVHSGWDREGDYEILLKPGKFLIREKIVSFVGLRLESSSGPIGALFVNFRSHHSFSSAELETIKIFANQASASIQQSRLFQRGEKKHYTVEALRRITELISSSQTEYPVWELILEEAMRITHARRGLVLHRVGYPPALKIIIAKGYKKTEKGTLTDCTLLRQVLQSHEPSLVLDLEQEKDIPPDCRKTCPGIRSLVATPFYASEDDLSVGVILLEDREVARFDPDDLDVLKDLSAYAGIAMQNANRLTQINENSRLQVSLLEANQKINSLGTEEEILQTITDNALQALDCDVVTLYTYDQKTRGIKFPQTISGFLKYPEEIWKIDRVERKSVVGRLLAKGEPHFTTDTTKDDLMSKSVFAAREDIVSSAGIPLKMGDQILGIFFVNFRRSYSFAPEQQRVIRLFADQAAQALYNSRQYDALDRKRRQLLAVHRAGKIITASVGKSRREILDEILRQAFESVTGPSGAKPTTGSIQIYHGNRGLTFESIYPPDTYPGQEVIIGTPLKKEYDKNRHEIMGVTRRAFEERKPQLVPDVSKNLDYFQYNKTIKSELAIPLLDNDQAIGVLDMESDIPNYFDQGDQEALQALAEWAVVAIQNAKQAEDLGEANMVAMMGAWGAEVTHDVNREVDNINWKVYELKQLPGLDEAVKRGLEEIDRITSTLFLPDLPESPVKAETMYPMDIQSELDMVLEQELNGLREKHKGVTIQFLPGCPNCKVVMHPRWLSRVLKHLVNNAAREMVESKTRQIIVRTINLGERAEIQVEDTGPGIPLEIESQLFISTVQKDNHKGMGLRLCKFIVEQCGGKIGLKWNHPGEGACFYFQLPILTSGDEESKVIRL